MHGLYRKSFSASLTLPVWTFSHFCVDFCCFYILYGSFIPSFQTQTAAVGILLYNSVAFGLQPLTGAYADAHHDGPVGAAGCALVLAALLLRRFVWAALLLCALGNACFHVAGGIDALTRAGGKLYRSGVFVSAGALGVCFGALAPGRLSAWLPAATLLLCAGLILGFCGGAPHTVPATG
ncbi:MAG: hypothetical protein VB092_10045, partial [Oscillospiraceae bacterium]|nr:hypothetical protein [Oscillospiraceae bacterium]